MDALQLVTTYFAQVSNEPDRERRWAAIQHLFASDLRYVDQDGTVNGRDAFAARINELWAMMQPGAQFTVEVIQQVEDLVVARWRLGLTSDRPVLTGTDVALIEEHRISCLWALLD